SPNPSPYLFSPNRHPPHPPSHLHQPSTSVAPSSTPNFRRAFVNPQFPSRLRQPPTSFCRHSLRYSVAASSFLRCRSLAPSALPLSKLASTLRHGPPRSSLVLLSVNPSA
ncbi:hypothetical protein PIB30_114236, partial [Stylosanthes scabra]|nr:hypothetical protein [Stylosanthes scabra]